MKRIHSFDLARGFTVLFIPAIHTGMLYSDIAVHDTMLGYFLAGIAEGPGGQLLMLLMGISFTFRKKHRTKTILIRSIGLLMAGYLLNFLKFIVPYSAGLLPEIVLQELAILDEPVIWQLLKIGDILHFSAFAILIIHFVYRTKNYPLWSIILTITIIFISPIFWDTHSKILVIDYSLQLVTGRPPQVFFPLLPWMVYPLVGLAIGHKFKNNTHRFIVICSIAGALLTIGGIFGDHWFTFSNPDGFYRTPPASTFCHLGIVLLTIVIWYAIDKYVINNMFFLLLAYSSKNITSIYIIQWVMICWMLPVFGYRTLDTFTSAFVMLLMTLSTYTISYTFTIINQHYGSKKNL